MKATRNFGTPQAFSVGISLSSASLQLELPEEATVTAHSSPSQESADPIHQVSIVTF